MVSGFASTCTGEKLQSTSNGYELTATCQTSGGTDFTTINLGQCLGNKDGTLFFKPGGVFGNTCKSVTLEDKDVLHASCLNSANKYDSTSINLDTLIANQGGKLVC
ncbi:MAG: hypothetical protein M1828_001922 [Chrysothrix sp. TS-e1954]|nr:MAG: hypothetical protein M1828_001922 [Chrysothrix sp. TS-e1954]